MELSELASIDLDIDPDADRLLDRRDRRPLAKAADPDDEVIPPVPKTPTDEAG